MWFRFKPFNKRPSIGCVLFQNKVYFRVLDVGTFLNYTNPSSYFKKHHGSKKQLDSILPEMFWYNFPKRDTVYDFQQLIHVLTKKQGKVKERVDQFLEMWYHGVLSGGDDTPSPYLCHLKYDTAPTVCVRRRVHEEEGILFQLWLREYNTTVAAYVLPFLTETLPREVDPSGCGLVPESSLDSMAPTAASISSVASSATAAQEDEIDPFSAASVSSVATSATATQEDPLPELQIDLSEAEDPPSKTDKDTGDEGQILLKMTFHKKDIFLNVESEEKKVVFSTLSPSSGVDPQNPGVGTSQRMMTIQAFRVL